MIRWWRRRRRSAARRQLARYLPLLPRLLRLLGRLARDPRVSALDKALVGLAITYVVTPIDLVPDVLLPLGLIDDLFLVGLVLGRLLNRADPEVLLEHWDGSVQELRDLVRRLDALGEYLPRSVRQRVQARAGG